MKTLEIAAADGPCPAWLKTPQGQGPWPGVILYMDGPGIRPAVHEIAERLASNGYAVLLPDLFYRSGPYGPVDPKIVFTDPKLREAHRETLMAPATPARVMADTAAFLTFLRDAPQVADGPIGVVGYCMGGRLALIAAGTYPDSIAVVASYHGGGLANDTPSSPHLLAPKIKARVYVAGAIEDANFDDAQKARLEAALTEAGVDHRVETYPAKHGWVPSDMPVHDSAEAEHHWATLVPLFDGVLKEKAR
ncbi:dienelactone hydrolase [Caulobacter sp. D4A]|uniref:dienelactone hydrolase family protein n=1 Tax=unclassified Caulobacter TaxID=2648921 RepID=UPI000D732470|nr:MULTISPECIES: dienelactone hydrolase family protein [unclassified Caulobacter]PXA91749.1 dienelactone hydrolase [Caulobacter sp. D4A]PXA92846.1 dienelactone hydrolase [Caulobacter sp. D5]